MKRPILFIPVLFGLSFAVGLGWIFWARHHNDSPPKLTIVRQTMEEGQPVVFFQVDGSDSRRIQIGHVERVIGERTDEPTSKPVQRVSSLSFKLEKDFWAPSSPELPPIGDPNKSRKEFGVVAPTNAPIWKLRVTIMEHATLAQRFKDAPGLWKHLRGLGFSIRPTLREAWTTSIFVGSKVVESDAITNSAAIQ